MSNVPARKTKVRETNGKNIRGRRGGRKNQC